MAMHLLKRLNLTTALWLIGTGTALAQGAAPVRQVTPLAQGWQFHFGDDQPEGGARDAGWEVVSLPHTWNRVGQYEAQTGIPLARRPIDKRQGVAWYRLDFAAPVLAQGQRAYLQFDAASRTAQVWVNGRKVGGHDGGFSRFRLDITDVLRPGQTNQLSVRVDNTQPAPGSTTQDILPLTGDFFVQGGLYRPVSLVVTEATHFDMLDDGGSGVYAQTTRIGATSADLAVVARVRNDAGARGLTLVSRLIDARGRQVARAETPLQAAANATREDRQVLTIARPHLWQGVASPYLYTLASELRDADGRLLDRMDQSVGIREVRIDPDKGLLLNGRPTPLHGVGLHQDSMAHGWAMSEADVERTVGIIRDMGANSIRLTHYQHGDAVHTIADRLGLIVWDEIPLVTAWTTRNEQKTATDQLTANARQQLRELVAQNRNHPSVVVWGIANEVDFGPSRPGFLSNGTTVVPDPLPLLRDLNTLAHQLDPSRPSAVANCCEDRDMPQVPPVADVPDVSAVNRYFGWYYDKPEDLGPHLDSLHKKRPGQPLALSEYGAGAGLSLHTDDVRGGPVDAGGRNQPEEYQADLHERTWPQIKARPWLWASWLWNSFDFGSTVRREGDAVDINTKGLVSYDGSVRKDAFYYYRAQWSDQPTVHITGRRYVDRNYGVTDVKVYSNAARTQLWLNGKLLGTMAGCENHVCVWTGVRLAPGENRLEARAMFAGKPVSDAIRWTLGPDQVDAYRIDSGAIVAARSAHARFGSDAFFDGGKPGTMDTVQRYRPPILAKIANSPDRDLVASYRAGDFRYRLPVPRGTYRVTLTFAEPSLPAGQRLFDVTANGKTMLQAVDVAALAGAPLTAIARTFTVAAGDAGLDLGFVSRKGEAIVSAVEVERDQQGSR
jgi:beta-galactosidase